MKKIFFLIICLLTTTFIKAQVNLNLKCYIEGYFRANGDTMTSASTNMACAYADPELASIIVVELHSTISPYEMVESGITEVELDTNGIATCIFDEIDPNNDTYYYIVVKTPNTLETWSSDTINFPTSTSGVASWDFTPDPNQAWASNETVVHYGANIFGLYSGDINQDGCITSADEVILADAIYNFDYGCDHISTDLNGDGNTDLLDTSILVNNLYICAAKP